MTKRTLDLNLLPVLLALVRHRSVTRAAGALGLTQPQVSRSLGRLRLQVGDPLLTRAGIAMEPTDTALALVEAWEPAIQRTAALVGARRSFDATTATGSFRVSMNDYESAALLPGLFVRLQEAAPRVRVAVVSLPPFEVAGALLQGRIELAVGRFVKPADTLRQKPLFDDTLVAAVRLGHPLARGKPTLERFVSFPHVLVAPGGRGDFEGLLDEQLLARGSLRQVALSVSQFLSASLVAARSDAVIVLPGRLLPIVAPWGLRPLATPPPLSMPKFRVSMLWRERSQREPAHRWLRELVHAAATPA